MFPSCYSKPKSGSQFKMSYTKVLFGVLVVYVLHTCWALYGFVHTKACDSAKGDDCVTSYLTAKPRLQSGVLPWKDSKYVRIVVRLTSQVLPIPSMALAGSAKQTQKGTEEQKVICHWKSRITLNMMTEDFTFNNAAVPSDMRRYMKISTPSNKHCNRNAEECQAPHDTCMTTVDILGEVKAIVKQCSSSRTCAGAAGTASRDANGNGNEVTCCSAHLCNISTATTIQLCTQLLTLPLSLLILLNKQ
ncbi:Cleft lip and palate transmembrane protein 1-like protein [Bagarius yarrelli]|uniref:Cleft lip and palate transmembrane protein 1-like protein n=1 Tax=Bagarius yarrelli TaxID=175774 RepID=A0A556TQ84_BAGYA|nr:Cleft lip and palate transmembrane protein 1-like protein [Bagarius yarrelli]